MDVSTANLPQRKATVWRKHYAIPPEHGAWFWLFGPLVVGVAAAGQATVELGLLLVAALAAFLLRQPVTLLVKAASGRRGRQDVGPSVFWAAVYGAVALAAVAGLAAAGHGRVLWLALPALPIFAAFLYLVSRKAERGQMLLEITGAAVLALTAPAAYWVCGGQDDGAAWMTWGITVAYIAASIVETYLRLRQRRMKEMPPVGERWRDAVPALIFHALNASVATGLALGGAVPGLVPIAYGLVLAAALEATQRPPVGAKPSRIGIRQLVVSVAFVLMVSAGYLSE